MHECILSLITWISSHGTMESGTDKVLRWDIGHAKINCLLCADILLRCNSSVFNIPDALLRFMVLEDWDACYMEVGTNGIWIRGAMGLLLISNIYCN